MSVTESVPYPLIVHLWRISDALDARLTRELARIGLTLAEFRLVGEVMRATTGLRQSELAARLGVTAPTVSAAVKRLEKDGVLRRRTDPSDPRARLVEIAPEAPLSTGLDILSLVQEGATRGLSAGEHEQLLQLLGKVTHNLHLED